MYPPKATALPPVPGTGRSYRYLVAVSGYSSVGPVAYYVLRAPTAYAARLAALAAYAAAYLPAGKLGYAYSTRVPLGASLKYGVRVPATRPGAA